MTKTIHIGTRGSKLALWQAGFIKSRLEKKHPRHRFELVRIKTTGDKILDVPLAKVGGKGLFVKEIEEALKGRRIDLAVHSMKDVPTALHPGLMVGVITTRENPGDVLISRNGSQLRDLPRGARIGTSSLRRQSQLLHFRPDITVVPLRGNLDTRIKKLETEQLDGIIVAAAGVIRLGWEDRISEFLLPSIMLPAIGQGALGIETRSNDEEINEIISFLHDPQTANPVMAERAFLERLEGGCQVPIAAFGTVQRGTLYLAGLIGSLDGVTVVRDTVSGSVENPRETGEALAKKLLAAGGKKILEGIYGRGGD